MKLHLSALTDPMRQLFFERGDEFAKGRRCMLTSAVTNSIAANLTAGVFYTGFLIGNDIDITRIGIITFIPYIASILSLFSPLILERFKKRRIVLAAARLTYYIINILGVTLLPVFFTDPTAKVWGFAVIVFLANAVNFLFGSGYSVWHIKFLPNDIRANYFSVSQFMVNLLAGSSVVISSILADALEGSPQQMTIIIILRYIALAFAVMDCIALMLPKEFPYEHSGKKLNPLDVLRIPMRNRKYLTTVSLYGIYAFVVNIPSSVLSAYLLSDIGVSYLVINGINAVYCLFFVAFSKIWENMIRRIGWIKTFAISMLLLAPTCVLHAFITPSNYMWLYVGVRLLQHFSGVGTSITASNLPYLNTPEEDRTNYMSFFNLGANLFVLAAMMFGTLMVSVMGPAKLNLGFWQYDSVQLLLVLQGAGVFALYLFASKKAKALEPKQENA